MSTSYAVLIILILRGRRGLIEEVNGQHSDWQEWFTRAGGWPGRGHCTSPVISSNTHGHVLRQPNLQHTTEQATERADVQM